MEYALYLFLCLPKLSIQNIKPLYKYFTQLKLPHTQPWGKAPFFVLFSDQII